MKLRSLLYVPASSKNFIAKAHLRNADAIILDLEDSVALEHKDQARKNLPNSIASVGKNGARVFVRINGDMETARLDIKSAFNAKAFGIYVSKANVKKLQEIDQLLTKLEGGNAGEGIKLVALIEDPAGVLEAQRMARQNRVFALSLGGEDFATAINAHPDPDVLRLPKQMLHYAAKAEGLLSFGMFRTVANYVDLAAMSEAACEAKRHGFDGASCVHPDIVEILNEAFAPSQQDIEWANRVLNKAGKTNDGAFSLDGHMIDEPVVKRARQILSD